MAKKKRQRQQSKKISAPAAVTPAATTIPRPPVVAEQRRPVATPPLSPARARSAATWDELSQRYTHVHADLKRIGIIAGSFLVVLLVLSAFLR